MYDPLTWSMPRLLLKQSLVLHLAICIFSFPLCMFIYLYTFSILHNGSIQMIPIILSAWIFRQKGAYLCFFATLVVHITYNIWYFRTLIWPLIPTLSLLIETVVMLIVAVGIVSRRKMYDHAEEAKLKTEQSEKQFAQAYAQQCQLNLIRDQFIINVNHELRTPLTAAYGYFEYLHLLLEQNGYLDKTLHTAYFKKALTYCEDLCSMVNNVLASMEIASYGKPLHLEHVGVMDAVYDIFESIDALCREQKRVIYLDMPLQLAVQANVHCLRNVLHHLISNAFKFSPEDAPITISADIAEWNASEVCISVKDDGPGIPTEEIPAIFEPFIRLKRDLAGTVRGTGLGLSISKHLVETMQGRLWVESAGIPGQGSCFRFTLPRAVEVQEARKMAS